MQTSNSATAAAGGFTIAINNDVPANNAVTLGTQTVFEDGLNNGQSTGIGGGTTTAVFTAAQLATLVNAGADEAVTIKLANATQLSGDTGLNSKGSQVNWQVVDATHINGVADGNRVVFTLVESPAGTFTLTLVDQVDHLSGLGDNDASVTLDLAKAFVATDFDGDFVQLDSGAVVAINNDVPANNAVTLGTQTVFEDGLNNGQSTGIGGGTTTAVFTAAQLATLVNAGADEAVTIKLANATQLSGDTGLKSKGSQVNWQVVDATHINGVADGNRVVFTLVESPAGTFTLTLVDQVDHLSGLGDNDASVTLDLAKAFVATDFDGDFVQLDSGAVVAINNDVPANNAVTLGTQTVFEDGLNNGQSTGIGGGTTTAVFTAAQLATLVNAGADEAVTIKLANATQLSGDTGLERGPRSIGRWLTRRTSTVWPTATALCSRWLRARRGSSRSRWWTRLII